MAAKIVDREIFKRDYLAGEKIEALAVRYGCGATTLWALRKALGLPERAGARGPKNGRNPGAMAPSRTPDRTRTARACAALLAALRAHHPAGAQ